MGSWFWHPSFWLPKGYQWEDIASTSEKQYPNFQDVLTYPLFIGSFIYLFRFGFLNPYVFEPLAQRLGLRYKIKKSVQKNLLLEKLFEVSGGKVSDIAICGAADSLRWTKRQVQRWLRLRTNQVKLNKLEKFQESAFVASYHVVISLYGLYVMHDKPWLNDISYTWKGFPKLEISTGEWRYYIISVSFYWAFCFSHLRSGVTEYIHHMITILLLTFSWAVNLIRAGSLVLLVHECGDIFLQIAKMCQYLKKDRATGILLFIFIAVWISTRLGLFPFWILKNMYFEAPKYVFMPAGHVFYFLLFGLLLLNIFWTGMIIIVIFKSFFKGSVINDIRSSESDHSSDDHEN